MFHLRRVLWAIHQYSVHLQLLGDLQDLACCLEVRTIEAQVSDGGDYHKFELRFQCPNVSKCLVHKSSRSPRATKSR